MRPKQQSLDLGRARRTDPQNFFFTGEIGYSDFLDASLSRTTVFFKKYVIVCAVPRLILVVNNKRAYFWKNTACTNVHSSKFSTKTS